MLTGEYLEHLLTRHRIIGANEYQVQDAIHLALIRDGHRNIQSEFQLSPRDRIDFLIDRVGIEVKVAGHATKVAEQLRRYAGYGCMSELVLVTTKSRHTTIRAGWDRTVSCPLRVIVLNPL